MQDIEHRSVSVQAWSRLSIDLRTVSAAPTGSNLRIGELSRRTGVSVELLRAWERRYALLSPSRTPGGYRLYDDADVRIVKRMVGHLAEGISAAEAARLARGSAGARSARSGEAEPAGPAPAQMREELRAALDDLQEAHAQELLDSLLSRYSLESVLRAGVLPYMRELGERWASGDASIGQEHFASALLRGRLLGLARGWGTGGGPLCLLACVPGDQHDIALICFGLALRGYGWRIVFLGPDTPLASVREVADSVNPAQIVLSATLPGLVQRMTQELSELARARPLALAGAGVSAEQAARVGALHLSQDPLEAAAEVFAHAGGSSR